ncbi:hypothetical protein F400_gp039 [Bacillus phage BCD7]|uniref:Uncharacterized protein n=1 Tax=Bacillus phage BCD7 TaxID=1136534 RepID=J9PUL1_9CAUD|nr:hypothetical protein F400_gp039 [Bacillus phage BCD7]AEZ50486.1 hypothetical protein BCD7_0039 [Bacillus phage BCD7]
MQIEGLISMRKINSEGEAYGSIYKEHSYGKVTQLWEVPWDMPLYYQDKHGTRNVQHPAWAWIPVKGLENDSQYGIGQVVQDGDYVIRRKDGTLKMMSAKDFNDRYEIVKEQNNG